MLSFLCFEDIQESRLWIDCHPPPEFFTQLEAKLWLFFLMLPSNIPILLSYINVLKRIGIFEVNVTKKSHNFASKWVINSGGEWQSISLREPKTFRKKREIMNNSTIMQEDHQKSLMKILYTNTPLNVVLICVNILAAFLHMGGLLIKVKVKSSSTGM